MAQTLARTSILHGWLELREHETGRRIDPNPSNLSYFLPSREPSRYFLLNNGEKKRTRVSALSTLSPSFSQHNIISFHQRESRRNAMQMNENSLSPYLQESQFHDWIGGRQWLRLPEKEDCAGNFHFSSPLTNGTFAFSCFFPFSLFSL